MVLEVQIPGPKGLPMVGNLIAFLRDPLGLTLSSAQIYGDVVRLRIGSKNFYLISHPAYIQEILVTKARSFFKLGPSKILKRDRKSRLRVNNTYLQKPALSNNSRYFLGKDLFKRNHIVTYESLVGDYINQVTSRWGNGEGKDIYQEMLCLTLMIVARTIYGVNLKISEASEINAAIREIESWSIKRLISPLCLSENIPIPSNNRAHRAMTFIDNTFQSALDEPSMFNSDDVNNVLAMITSFKAKKDGSASITNKQLQDEVMSFFIAGHLSLATTLSWTWYLLSTHPQIQRKLEAELNEILGNRHISLADLPRLKYTEMIVWESMRLYPPFWTQARVLMSDYLFGTYRVPSGSIILISQYVMHRHPKYWDDPERFCPERFDPDLKHERPRFTFFPFGGGHHQCIGQAFSIMVAKLIIANVTQRYQFELLPQHPIDVQAYISLRPKYGIKMSIAERQMVNGLCV